MNKFEVTRRLAEELNIPNLHLNFGSDDIEYGEEEYQELKEYFLKRNNNKPNE